MAAAAVATAAPKLPPRASGATGGGEGGVSAARVSDDGGVRSGAPAATAASGVFQSITSAARRWVRPGSVLRWPSAVRTLSKRMICPGAWPKARALITFHSVHWGDAPTLKTRLTRAAY